MSSWLWILRSPPTGSCWREKSPGWVKVRALLASLWSVAPLEQTAAELAITIRGDSAQAVSPKENMDKAVKMKESRKLFSNLSASTVSRF
ncbi:hypothetical protein FKM82_009508 [Ascaphus truei]